MKVALLIANLILTGVVRPAGPPQRIISMSPLVTEILYGVGAFDRVVAVSDYCTYPPAVKNLPRIGGWQTSSLEKIVSLRPDLIIMTDVQAATMTAQFRRLGFAAVAVPSRSLNDAFVAINQIGQAVGRNAQATALVQETRTALESIRTRTNTAPKRRVLVVVDRTPGTLREMIAATPGSFLSELVEIAGGQLVTAPTALGYVRINKEALVSLNPEVIIDIIHTVDSRLGEDQLAVWGALPELRAVRDRRIHPVRNEFILHTSQFVSQSARLLAEVIHPELFAKGPK
jgi:iron complex transport system substrate-binding protein